MNFINLCFYFLWIVFEVFCLYFSFTLLPGMRVASVIFFVSGFFVLYGFARGGEKLKKTGFLCLAASFFALLFIVFPDAQSDIWAYSFFIYIVMFIFLMKKINKLKIEKENSIKANGEFKK